MVPPGSSARFRSNASLLLLALASIVILAPGPAGAFPHEKTEQWEIDTGAHPTGIVISDMNGDGLDDIVYGGSDGWIGIHLQDEDIGFYEIPHHTIYPGGNTSGLCVSDLNGDTKPDIVAALSDRSGVV